MPLWLEHFLTLALVGACLAVVVRQALARLRGRAGVRCLTCQSCEDRPKPAAPVTLGISGEAGRRGR